MDHFEQDGYQYLIQEFIEGQNLAEVLKEGQVFTESEVKTLLETLLETIDFLHHRNIIHRDIKPANIIQTSNGEFVLVDLGAAKLATGTALGHTGTVIGSAEYVAPEQLRGKAIFASDIYSLGATCVTLLTGVSPFSLFDTSTEQWEWRDYLPQPVDDRLGKILDRMLVAPTRKRYESAELVLQDLLNEQSKLQDVRITDRFWQGETIGQSEKEFDVKSASKLGIDPTPLGQITKQARRKKILIPFSIAVGMLITVGFSQKNLQFSVSEPPKSEIIAPTPPITEPPSNPPQAPLDMTGMTPLADIIKPTYDNSVKPFKVFRNIPPFKTISLADGGNTVVTGLLSSTGKINLNVLDIASGKNTSLDFQTGLNIKESEYSIHIKEDNILLRAEGGGTDQLKQLQIFNIKSKSFIYHAAENVGFIFSVPYASTGPSNIKYSSTTNLLKISGNKVSERKVEVPGAGGRDVLSLDEKNIFSWNQYSSSQTGSPSIINWSLETGKFKSRFLIPNLISQSSYTPDLMQVSQYAGNQFLVASGGGMSILDAGVDRRKVLAYLPDLYKDKDTQSTKKNLSGSHDGSIYVFDVTQEKFKYFIPRVGRVVGLAVSSDGKTMVTVENPRDAGLSKLMIWDLPTGRLIRSVNTHYSMNYDDTQLFFTSDSKSLIVAAPDIRFSGEKLQKSADTPDISIYGVDELRNP